MERLQSGSGFSKLRRSGCRQTTPNPKRSAYLQSLGGFTRQSDKSRDCPRYLVRHLSGSGGRIRLLTVLSVMLVVGALQLAIQPPSRRYIKRIEPLRLQSPAEVRCRQEVGGTVGHRCANDIRPVIASLRVAPPQSIGLSRHGRGDLIFSPIAINESGALA